MTKFILYYALISMYSLEKLLLCDLIISTKLSGSFSSSAKEYVRCMEQFTSERYSYFVPYRDVGLTSGFCHGLPYISTHFAAWEQTLSPTFSSVDVNTLTRALSSSLAI